MSYILDAIAKSEQERQQQEIPGAQILAIPADSLRQPRRLMPYLVVGALLLNAAALLIWMQSNYKNLADVKPIATIPEVSTEIDKSASMTESVTVSTPIGADTASVGVATNTFTTEKVAVINSAASMKESITESDIKTSANSGKIDADLLSESENLRLESSTATTDEDTAEWIHIGPDTLSNNARPDQPVDGGQNLQGPDVLYRKISRLRDLPDYVRRDVPKIVFSGHLYSSNPESSAVFVDDGRALMKGRQIKDELYLYEITPTGIIVEFRGYLINVGVLQNWTLN